MSSVPSESVAAGPVTGSQGLLLDVRYINPFIQSVQDLFGTMLQAWVRRGEVALRRATLEPATVTGVIGVSGPLRGTVTVAFPVTTALQVVGRLLGEELTTMNDDVVDGVAEVLNIIAGGAKARLQQGEAPPLDLGLPTVITGEDHRVRYPSDALWLDLPFDSELGSLNVRVTFEANPHQG